jgi:hypothetical protein
METIRLSDAIAELRAELLRAMEAAEREALQFKLGPVEVELHVQRLTTAKAEAGMKWVVISASGEASGQRADTHKIKVTLAPVHADGREAIMINEESEERRQ